FFSVGQFGRILFVFKSSDVGFKSVEFKICFSFKPLVCNVFVYGKLRVWGRGFSEGKSEAGKQATNFVLAKNSNFLYTVLATVFITIYLFQYLSRYFHP